MCGIFGYYAVNSQIKQEEIDERLKAALINLRHRGPDDNGIEALPINNNEDSSVKQLYLGHTRLSIIDLSTAGHQPMYSKDGRFCLIFNGEIYNYKEIKEELLTKNYHFKTDSDTEVLIAAWQHWGANGINRLVGMFAFVVYDRQDSTLTLVRDAFGIKPIFYLHTNEELCFASEVSAISSLINIKLTPNLNQAYNYLTTGEYDYGDTTFYSGVKQLMPGHLIRFDLKSNKLDMINRWWWPSIKERSDLTFKEAAAELREIFLKNIRMHLRSDVPVGAALSGGLDSSAVVCAMRFVDPNIPINTFTYVDRGSAINEEKWADIVNKHVSAIPHKVLVDPNDLGNDIEDLIKTQGEPFGGTSIYAQYRVFKEARETGVIVTLDGQGADELLAGYNGYPHGYVLSLYENKEYVKIVRFLRKWAEWPSRSYLQAFRLIATITLPPKILAFLLKIFNKNPLFPEWIDKNFVINNKFKTEFYGSYLRTEEGKGRRLVEQLRSALTLSGLSPLLRHGDRDSMRWSVESRVPFLTTELAEFVLSLPESYLLSEDGQTKHIFRESMRGIVPDEILDRRDKIGFETPEFSWLFNQKNLINNLFKAEQLKILNSKISKKEVNEVLNGDKKFGRHVWRLINYSYWYQVNFNSKK